jgi:hypothetical protein
MEDLLSKKGIMLRAEGILSEEAYNVDRVTEVSHNLGIATKVARPNRRNQRLTKPSIEVGFTIPLQNQILPTSHMV